MSEMIMQGPVIDTTLPAISADLARRLNELRNRRRDGEKFNVEQILVDSFALVHGKLTGVLVGGFGPDKNAPPVYHRGWSESDLVGGVYAHPRIPAWYHRSEFVVKFKDLAITRFLTEELGSEFDPTNPHFVLWAIMQIYG